MHLKKLEKKLNNSNDVYKKASASLIIHSPGMGFLGRGPESLGAGVLGRESWGGSSGVGVLGWEFNGGKEGWRERWSDGQTEPRIEMRGRF